jgi:hypothetical protein
MNIIWLTEQISKSFEVLDTNRAVELGLIAEKNNSIILKKETCEIETSVKLTPVWENKSLVIRPGAMVLKYDIFKEIIIKANKKRENYLKLSLNRQGLVYAALGQWKKIYNVKVTNKKQENEKTAGILSLLQQ